MPDRNNEESSRPELYDVTLDELVMEIKSRCESLILVCRMKTGAVPLYRCGLNVEVYGLVNYAKARFDKWIADAAGDADEDEDIE